MTVDSEFPLGSADHRDVVTAVSHLYRAEMNRMSVWRQRLDVTSNWAVILATALTTFTLGSAEVPHYTLLLGLALVRGRDYVVPQDVIDVIPDVLRHRLVLTYDALADDVKPETVISRILQTVALPQVNAVPQQGHSVPPAGAPAQAGANAR